MSNYTPIVSYGPKDSLSHGDPNKALKGVQIDAELNAISTAIATKVDSPLANITVTGAAVTYAITALGSGTSGQSYGTFIKAGTTSGDVALSVVGAGGGTPYLSVRGDGHLLAAGVDFTLSTGGFSATFSGAASGAVNLSYYKIGPVVTLYTNTSQQYSSGGGGTLTMTALPVAIRPTITVQGTACVGVAGGSVAGVYALTSGGVMNFNSSSGGALPASNLGVSPGTVCTYILQ